MGVGGIWRGHRAEEVRQLANEEEAAAHEEIAALDERARAAKAQIEKYTQEQVDQLSTAMVWAVAKPGVAEKIARFTVDETQLGNYEGKFLKISRKTRATLYDIINDKSVGVIEEDPRSVEHTSELQSLMRISYDVFCLKKKQKNHIIKYTYVIQARLL